QVPGGGEHADVVRRRCRLGEPQVLVRAERDGEGPATRGRNCVIDERGSGGGPRNLVVNGLRDPEVVVGADGEAARIATAGDGELADGARRRHLPDATLLGEPDVAVRSRDD